MPMAYELASDTCYGLGIVTAVMRGMGQPMTTTKVK